MAKVKTYYLGGVDSDGHYCCDRIPPAAKDWLESLGLVWEDDGPDGVIYTCPENVEGPTVEVVKDQLTKFFVLAGWTEDNEVDAGFAEIEMEDPLEE